MIGSGGIGEIHCRAYRELADTFPTVFSFCDSNRKRAEEQCKLFDGQAVYTDMEEAVHAKDVDILDICLPHDLHVKAMELAAPSGKHVILEKPMARSVAECDQIMDRIQSMNAVFMVAECWRFYPHIVKAIESIQAGDVGEVVLIETCSMDHFLPPSWRSKLSSMGGGALLDRGVHFVDMLVSLGGSIRSVFSVQSGRSWKEMEGEDTSVLTCLYESGAMASQIISWGVTQSFDRPFFTVHGTRGTLMDGKELLLLSGGQEPRVLAPFMGEGWPDYYMIVETLRHFLDCVANGKTPAFTPTQARYDVEIVTAAYASGQQGRSIDLPYRGPGGHEW